MVLNAEQCKARGIDVNRLSEESTKNNLLEQIGKHMRNFPGYAQIYQITATLDPWEVENGLLTATLKVKREKVKELFAEQITAMYEGH